MENKKQKIRILPLVLAIVGLILIFVHIFINIRFPVNTEFDDIVNGIATEHNIEPALIFAVINAESGFDKTAVSPVGAKGLMQLMPRTAEFMADKLGLGFSEDRLFEPEFNITLGTAYLARLLNRFDLDDAIAAYNAGEGNVANWLANDLTQIPFRETRNYVRRVKVGMWFYRNR